MIVEKGTRAGGAVPSKQTVGDKRGGWRNWLGGIGLALLLALLIWGGQYAGRHFDAIEDLIAQLGHFGPVLFVAVYVFFTPFGFPVSVLGFAAGAMFGVVGGSLILTVAALLAAALIYPLGHRILRARVLAYAAARPKLDAFVTLAARDAAKLMVLVRLSPLNFALASYLLAASGVRLRTYLAGTLLVLPSAALQAYLGYAARRLGRVAGGLDSSSRADDLLTLTGLIVGLILLTVIGNMARKAAQTAADEAVGELSREAEQPPPE